MYEYLQVRSAEGGARSGDASPAAGSAETPHSVFRTPHSQALPAIDRTPKLFIGGKQVRPDQGYSRPVLGPDGRQLGEVGDGNRKDIRDAVEAAHAAAGWGRGAGHLRAQILYYVAENLSARADELGARIVAMTGAAEETGRREVEATIARLFTYAAWADKFDGAVHQVPIRGVTLAMHEPIGVMGLAAPETHPLLGFVSLVAPAIAVGNTVVVVPSSAHPLAATDFYGVLETSDLPDGVVNIVTGEKEALAQVLSEHLDVDAVWFSGSEAGGKAVEATSVGNMKRTWLLPSRDWLDPREGEGREFLRHATQVKNIWIPYGE